MNEFDASPMSPDDFNALMSIAGPLFGESRNIEMMTSDNTVVGSHIQDGSMKIKGALEQAEHLVRAHRPPPPQYTPPEYIQAAQSIVSPTPDVGIMNLYVPYPTERTSRPEPDDGQLMLQFDKDQQQVTNDLLTEISRKLTKVIGLLEDIGKEKDVTVPKLKPNVKNTI